MRPLRTRRRLPAQAVATLLWLVTLMAGSTPVSAAGAAPSGPDAVRPRVMQAAAAQAAAPPARPMTPFLAAAPLVPRPAGAAPGASGSAPGREVFGFVNAGNLGDPTVGYRSWDFADLSTVAFFGLHVNSGDGSLVTTDTGWAEWSSSDLTGLLAAAHAAGVRVVVSVILQDSGAAMCAGLAHAATTVSQIAGQVAAKGVDGVDVDYEGVAEACGGASSRDLLTAFVRGLRQAMPQAYLSIDTYAGSAGDGAGFFDVGDLAPSVDAFFVMAYDLDGTYASGNWAYPPLSCPSYCLSPTAPLTTYRYNDTSVAAAYVSAVGAGKVILGVPYYGYTACVAPQSAGRPRSNAIAYPPGAAHWVVPRYLDSSTTSDATPGVSGYLTGQDGPDDAGQEAVSTWSSSTYGCWRESYWDDLASLAHKYDLVNADHLRGVGIFALDYGGGDPGLWGELSAKFGVPTTFDSLGGTSSASPALVSWGAGRLDAFVRGTDGGLWHAYWRSSVGWVGWESLGGQLTSDPVAVAWGPGRLDVFARGTDDQLWHRWWDGTGWHGWEPLGGQLASDPVPVSWAPNRLDVLVRGADGGLWHAWWDGTMWHRWEPQGGRLTSDPAAVAWGPNRLDVFGRGTDGQLWHRWWDGTAWHGWEPLGGQLTPLRPAIAAWAANRLDVLAVGVDGQLWHQWWDGTRWSGWTPEGAAAAFAPAAASTGAGRLLEVVVGAGADLWHRTWTGAGWTAWQADGGDWASATPAAVSRAGSGVYDVIVVRADGSIWHTSA